LSNDETARLATLITIEQSARQAETLVELRFVIANETRELVPYTQGLLLTGKEGESLKVTALSDLPLVDRTAPFVTWVERLVRQEITGAKALEVYSIDRERLPQKEQQQALGLSPRHLLCIPLLSSGKGRQGALILTHHNPWDRAQIALLKHLGGTYGHALGALTRPQVGQVVWRWINSSYQRWIALIAIAALMGLRVHLTALAPAEVTPRDPAIVTAPMDGVVERIAVQPNDQVTEGDLLISFEDVTLKSTFEVAERALAVSSAELHKTRQSSFGNPRERGHVAELEARVDLRQAELDFARTQLEKAQVRADRSGLAIVGDPDTWEGRPVDVGERILRVADPKRVKLTIMLAVRDAVVLKQGSTVKLFLDIDPLNARMAEVERATYEPSLTPEGHLAYRVTARFVEAEALPRIGLRGTAKIYGPRVSVFYYLFRRPLTALRQWSGF
jgi:hypothetical protein